MRKLKIYLETTIFNYYFDEERDAYADTMKLFNDIKQGKYEAFTSTYVTDELENAPIRKRKKMMGLIVEYGITVLAPNEDAVKIAEIYIAEKVIPQKYLTDGLHIAVAAVNDLDIIISMNFQHIVKRKTKLATGSINILNGYRAIEICTPMEVNEHEIN